jgi:hypothetical protein
MVTNGVFGYPANSQEFETRKEQFKKVTSYIPLTPSPLSSIYTKSTSSADNPGPYGVWDNNATKRFTEMSKQSLSGITHNKHGSSGMTWPHETPTRQQKKSKGNTINFHVEVAFAKDYIEHNSKRRDIDRLKGKAVDGEDGISFISFRTSTSCEIRMPSEDQEVSKDFLQKNIATLLGNFCKLKTTFIN